MSDNEHPRGMRVAVLRSDYATDSRSLFAKREHLTIVGIVDTTGDNGLAAPVLVPMPLRSQMREADDDAPAVYLVKRSNGFTGETWHLAPAHPDHLTKTTAGYGASGLYAHPFDSRVSSLVGFYGAIAVHDYTDRTADQPPAEDVPWSEQMEDAALARAGREEAEAARRYAELLAAKAARLLRETFPTATHLVFDIGDSSDVPHSLIAVRADDTLLWVSVDFVLADEQTEPEGAPEDWAERIADLLYSATEAVLGYFPLTEELDKDGEAFPGALRLLDVDQALALA